LTFCKKNNAKIILLIISYVYVNFFLYQAVILQKKGYMNIYGDILYISMFIYRIYQKCGNL